MAAGGRRLHRRQLERDGLRGADEKRHRAPLAGESVTFQTKFLRYSGRPHRHEKPARSSARRYVHDRRHSAPLSAGTQRAFGLAPGIPDSILPAGPADLPLIPEGLPALDKMPKPRRRRRTRRIKSPRPPRRRMRSATASSCARPRPKPSVSRICRRSGISGLKAQNGLRAAGDLEGLLHDALRSHRQDRSNGQKRGYRAVERRISLGRFKQTRIEPTDADPAVARAR